MKQCTWCGAEYPDELKLCPLDQRELSPQDPATGSQKASQTVANLFKPWRDDPPDQIFQRQTLLREILELSGRYLAACLVSFFGAIFFLLAILFLISLVPCDSPFITISFLITYFSFGTAGGLGVLLGTFCLPSGVRAFGSLAIWVILSAWCCYLSALSQLPDPYAEFNFAIPFKCVLASMIGGAITVSFFTWKRRPKYRARPASRVTQSSA